MTRRIALACAVAIFIALLLLAFAVWLRVRPMAGEWTMRVPIAGRLGVDVSVPRAIQLATDPSVARWLHRRTVATSAGDLRLTWQKASATLVVRCAPCALRAAGLGARPLVLSSATLSAHRDGDWRLSGQLASGGVVLPWQARLSRQGIEVAGALAAMPIAEVYALFGAHVPELGHARIEGDVAASWRVEWPRGRWTVQPRLEGFAVDGLGTSAFTPARLPARCAVAPGTRPPSPWLARAVVAAEDQRFFEHPGYDLDATLAAFDGNQQGKPAVSGASTLTQQLAKLAYTGDERSAARKLRELLYAVEMERTLGKARILELYLALAPWGEGVCGAERAAQRHFGKPAHALDPIEAAWLASLLRDPASPADADRVAWVLKGMARGERQRQRWTRALDRLSPAAASAPDAASP